MNDMSPARARDQLKRAHEVFRAAGGSTAISSREKPKAPERAREISCDDLLTAAAVLMWFAAEATIHGGDAQFYVRAAEAMEAAAQAQGCT